MAKKKITPIVENDDAENPAPESINGAEAEQPEKKKRVRRKQNTILLDRLQKRFGGYPELKEALASVMESVKELENMLAKAKKNKKALPTEDDFANMPDELFAAYKEMMDRAEKMRRG